jgi:integrase
VDLERACLRLRDAKAGPRVVFLDRPALDVLEGLPRTSERVFPATRGEGHVSPAGLKWIWQEVRKTAGLEGPPAVRLHDLRHSHASMAATSGYSLPMIGALLGHREQATTARYVHLVDDPLREASGRVQGRIGAALAGRPDAAVVGIRPRR